ncbi:MAG TPA: hypothetical protein VG269_26600 [Tepidisphaeraceae bacterium]|jgi:hypothetical protein|nr:hypothetical protein [Tepidisphaeraceae bacterium]
MQPESVTPAVNPMRPCRMLLATLAVAVIVVGHAYSIATQHPHWPFHDYTMYSALTEEPRYDRLQIRGVTEDGREIPFSNQASIAPIPLYHLRMGFVWVDMYKKGREEAMEALCRDTLRRYEDRRLAGLHPGPPLVKLRVYQLHWEPIDAQPHDVATPTSVTLRFEGGDSRRASAGRAAGPVSSVDVGEAQP